MTADELIECTAEALHNLEYPTWSETACADHNRWSWRGDGFLGENGETDHYDEYRETARGVLAAVLPKVAETIETFADYKCEAGAAAEFVRSLSRGVQLNPNKPIAYPPNPGGGTR